jgi:hypothetical protein
MLHESSPSRSHLSECMECVRHLGVILQSGKPEVVDRKLAEKEEIFSEFSREFFIFPDRKKKQKDCQRKAQKTCRP